MRALTVEGIGHAYGGHEVLAGVTLEVTAGELTAVVGPSGSGKSTLLSIAGLLLRPDAGTVRVGDRPPAWALPTAARLEALRAVGWVFQSMNALGRRTAGDNVVLPLVARGEARPTARRRARKALEEIGIDHLADQRAAELSGGELQRMCIARALAGRPDVVVADEPTGQLDHASSDRVVDALRRAADLGTAVLLATHDLEAAARADRVLHLRDGRLTDGPAGG